MSLPIGTRVRVVENTPHTRFHGLTGTVSARHNRHAYQPEENEVIFDVPLWVAGGGPNGSWMMFDSELVVLDNEEVSA